MNSWRKIKDEGKEVQEYFEITDKQLLVNKLLSPDVNMYNTMSSLLSMMGSKPEGEIAQEEPLKSS